MRKFAFLSVLFCLVSWQSALAQPRDLFAEFEAETAAENADSTKAADTPAKPAEAPAAPASSSSAVLSSSSIAAPVSSSEVTPASSSAVAPADSATVKPDSAVVADTAAARPDTAAIAVADTSVAKQDSAAVDSLLQSSSSVEISSSSAPADSVSSSSVEVAQVPSSSSMSRRDLLGPVKVSKVYGIDEMKGRYKSPRKALFMSMVIPGSGQLYVGGSTFTNVRGVAYLALEAALWGGWYYYSVYKYDKQVNKYKKFAKNHFSIGRFESQMRDIYLNQLSDETIPRASSLPTTRPIRIVSR